MHVQPPLTGAHLCSIGREQLLQRALLAAGDRAEPKALAVGALRGARLHVTVDALPQRLAPAPDRARAQPAARPPRATCRQLADAHHSQPAPCSSQLGVSGASGGAAAPSSPDITVAAGAEPKRRSLRVRLQRVIRAPEVVRELRQHSLRVAHTKTPARPEPLLGKSGDIYRTASGRFPGRAPPVDLEAGDAPPALMAKIETVLL